jgi:hypothetical protein
MARGNKKGNLAIISTTTHSSRKGNGERERSIVLAPTMRNPIYGGQAVLKQSIPSVGGKNTYTLSNGRKKLILRSTGHCVQNIGIPQKIYLMTLNPIFL